MAIIVLLGLKCISLTSSSVISFYSMQNTLKSIDVNLNMFCLDQEKVAFDRNFQGRLFMKRPRTSSRGLVWSLKTKWTWVSPIKATEYISYYDSKVAKGKRYLLSDHFWPLWKFATSFFWRGGGRGGVYWVISKSWLEPFQVKVVQIPEWD